MSQLPFEIRHGKFLDILGSPVRQGDVTLVPAHVKLNGTSLSPVFSFFEWCESTGHSIPLVVHGQENAPWVLGRLMAVFNTENTPEDDRSEKSCLNASFLAILHGDNEIAIPFDCSDYYGQTSIYFSSEDSPADEHQERIAKAYFELLLSDPDDLIDYDNKMYHSGAGVCIAFGILHGEPYIDAE